ncbi:tol-pal system YbgF family protein [Candidatus Uabimicrobium sp. HlEnr_7]|uniref:tetratricopeptide repeat protein n=1 Tax=Candidatus Uabimicrobium helgolandensis TaxID=3095367 RepID=UPI003558442F
MLIIICGLSFGFGLRELYIRATYFSQKIGIDTKTKYTHSLRAAPWNYIKTQQQSPLLQTQKILNTNYCCKQQKRIILKKWGEHLLKLKEHKLLKLIIDSFSSNSPEYLHLQANSNKSPFLYLQELHNKFPHHIYSQKSRKEFLLLKIKNKQLLSSADYYELLDLLIYKNECETALKMLDKNNTSHLYYFIKIHYKQQQFHKVVKKSKDFLTTLPKSKYNEEILWKLSYSLSHRLKECKQALVYYDMYLQKYLHGKYFANVLLAKGDTLICVNNPEKALQSYLQLIKSNCKQHLKQIASYSIGNIYFKNHNHHQAILFWEKALTYQGTLTKKIAQKIKEITND